VHFLAICGSLRCGSSNANVLAAVRLLAAPAVDVAMEPPLDALPFFNPDIEAVTLPPTVAAFRARVAASDALLICSPEYAHGVTGVLKNALDWLVGGIEITDKPIAVLNGQPRATIADTSVRETLRVMGGRVVDAACVGVPLRGRKLDARDIADDAELAGILRSAIGELVQVVTSPPPGNAAMIL
jgi:NAD(P)H-dependent FMN reductase